MLTDIKLDKSDSVDNKMQNDTSPYDKSEGYRAILSNINFLALWLGQVFSQLGDRVIFVVFVAVIASKFGASTSIQSWLYISFTIPAILLTALAGVFIDRWNKKYILISTNILRALLIALLPLFSKTLFDIYALAFLVSSVTQFFVPAEASSIPDLVKKDQLLAANSLFTTTMMASIIFGFVLGDPLINIFGLKSVHVAITALFLISAFCLSFIRHKFPVQENQKKTLSAFFDELKQGFRYIRDNSVILHAMLKLTSLFSIIVMLSILAIGISQQKLYPLNPALGAQKFVYIVASSGIGMVISALMVGKLFRNINKYKLIYPGFIVIGVNLILLIFVGFIPSHLCLNVPGGNILGIYLEPFNLTFRMIYTYFISGLIGSGCALVAIPVQTILHSSVPEDVRGKVFGVQFTMLSTSSTLPVLIAAFGADLIGVTKMLIIIGIPVALFGIYNSFKTKIANT